MNTDRLPEWAWLLLALFVVAIVTNLVYVLVLSPIGWPESYLVVVLIASMTLVVIYFGIWNDDSRAHYWERSRAARIADAIFMLVTAMTVGGLVVAVGIDAGLSQLVRELLAMVVGFVSAWALFYFRNPDLYSFGG